MTKRKRMKEIIVKFYFTVCLLLLFCKMRDDVNVEQDEL